MRVLLMRHYDEKKVPEEALAISMTTAKSKEEIELANLLAERAFMNGTNIANKFKYEFLLWLTGKTDIKSALHFSAPAAGSECLVVLFKDPQLQDTVLAKLRKTAEPLDIERISLSRVKN